MRYEEYKNNVLSNPEFSDASERDIFDAYNQYIPIEQQDYSRGTPEPVAEPIEPSEKKKVASSTQTHIDSSYKSIDNIFPTTSLISSVFTVVISAIIAFLLYKIISTKRKALNETMVGRNWFAIFYIFSHSGDITKIF